MDEWRDGRGKQTLEKSKAVNMKSHECAAAVRRMERSGGCVCVCGGVHVRENGR